MKVVHRSLREQESRDRALVLTAMDIEHELERGWVGWRIAVPLHEESRAQEQWRLYDLENTLARSSVARSGGADIVREGAAASTACWVVLLIARYVLQSRHAFGIDWVGLGRLDVGAIRSGEWWRAITALTLHVDAPHLIANIGFGAVFGTLLGRAIGGGLAWFTILIGGTVGNLMNVAVQRPEHTAIGASTAVLGSPRPRRDARPRPRRDVPRPGLHPRQIAPCASSPRGRPVPRHSGSARTASLEARTATGSNGSVA